MREIHTELIKNVNRKLKSISLTMFNFDDYKIKIFWLRLIRENETYNEKEHSHSFFEIHYVTRGSFKIVVNDVECEANSDEYVLVPPSTKHRIVSVSDDFHKLVWGFEVEKGEVPLRGYSYKNTATYTQKQCIDMLFSDEFKRYGDVSAKLSLELFLSRALEFKTKSEKTFDDGSEVFEKVERFVLDNVCSNITVDDIAMNFDISARHLSRICEKFTGVTFGRFLREQKINKACTLLPRYTVKETADMLGYSDEFSFSKSFSAVTGKTPSLWRKENR